MPYLIVPLSFVENPLVLSLVRSQFLSFYATHIFTFIRMHQSSSFGSELLSVGWELLSNSSSLRCSPSDEFLSIQWIANAMINQVRMYRSLFWKFSCKSHLALVMIIFRMRSQSDRFLSRSHPTSANVFNDYFFFLKKNLEYYVATLLSSFRQIKMFQVYGMIATFKQVFASIESNRFGCFSLFTSNWKGIHFELIH